jgi:hypothetical protein
MWWRWGGSCIEKLVIDGIRVGVHTNAPSGLRYYLELMGYPECLHGIGKRFFCDDKALRVDRQHHVQ